MYYLDNLDCDVAITQNFYHSGCVFNVAWAQYNIPSLCNKVTKQVIVARIAHLRYGGIPAFT